VVVLITLLAHLKAGTVFKALSYGTNMYDTGGGARTIHAEANAIYNLPSRPRSKKLKSINILVIRTSVSGKLGMSKPCAKCLLDMIIYPPKKGYTIKNIYYSNSQGDIVETTLKNIIEDGNLHISKYYKNHNFINPFEKK
jgi:cytidine deaminase